MSASDNVFPGATAGDWPHFDMVLGLGSDLLPVVPDPNATPAPNSVVSQFGKTPSVYDGEGNARGISKWGELEITPAHIAKWSADRRLSLCVRASRVRAIDIDLPDAADAQRVLAAIERIVPASVDWPRRARSNSAKLLLPFRLSAPLKKRRIVLPGDRGAIEALGDGQHFVACGSHPSGARYEWRDGLPTEFPTLTADQFEAIWNAIYDEFKADGAVMVGQRDGEPGSEWSGTADSAVLRTIDEPTLKQLREALFYPPLVQAAGAGLTWTEVGYSLLSIAQGRELFAEFSRAAPNYQAGDDEVWWQRHLGAAPRTDHRHIFAMSRRLGWGAAADPSQFPIIAETATEEQPAARKPTRKPFEFTSPREDLLFTILPERDFAIHPYFPRSTVSLLLSMGGLGKTNILIDFAISKALGIALPGTDMNPPTPGRFVILTAEDDEPEMQRRLQKILKELLRRDVKIDMQLLRRNLQIVDLSGAVDNRLVRAGREGADPTDLVEHIAQQVGHADVIALDTLSRFNGGEENSNSDGATLISACETIAKRTGAAVVVVAHTGKQVAREGVVDLYAARGASSYADNARSVLVLSSPSSETLKKYDINEAAVERGDVFRMHHAKCNYARRAPDMHFERLENGVVMPFVLTAKDIPSEDALVTQLRGYIGEGEIRRNEVYARYITIFGNDVTRVQALEVFDRAVKSGALKLSHTKNNADYFKVADTSARAAVDAPMRPIEDML